MVCLTSLGKLMIDAPSVSLKGKIEEHFLEMMRSQESN